MPINARTVQILYVIHQLSQDDETTTAQDISDFIATRRKSSPDLYSKAYIAPGALMRSLNRMSAQEGLLDLYWGEGTFSLSVKGSQMAEMFHGVDACSTPFIDNYKEEICKAALDQLKRLGQGPASPREVATFSNISLDSARRGLASLTAKGEATEDRSSRTPTYQRILTMTTLDNDTIPSTERDQSPQPTDTGTPEGADDIASLLASIVDDPMGPDDIPLGMLQDNWGDAESPYDDEIDVAPWHFDAELFKASPYAWGSVDNVVLHNVVMQAKACGMALNDFLKITIEANASRMQMALRAAVKPG